MVVTLGQPYNVGEKPAVILTPNITIYDNYISIEQYKNRGLGQE